MTDLAAELDPPPTVSPAARPRSGRRGRPSKARGRPNSSDAAEARWTVRGVPPPVRELALKAAEARNMTVGDWLAETIVTVVRGAERAARQDGPKLPTVEMPADLPNLLAGFEQRLARLEQRQQRSILDVLERWLARR